MAPPRRAIEYRKPLGSITPLRMRPIGKIGYVTTGFGTCAVIILVFLTSSTKGRDGIEIMICEAL